MKDILLEYIIKNKKNFIIVITLFCIGILIGIVCINNLSENQKNETNSYVQNLIKNIKETENVNKLELLFLSIKQNIFFILLIWFLGCTIIGGLFIYITIIYRGFTLGYTISALIAVLGVKQGILIVLVSLVLQNLIFLPAFFILAENGIKLYKGIYKKCINLKEEVIRHSAIMLISIMLSIVSSVIEVYISMNLLFFLKEII